MSELLEELGEIIEKISLEIVTIEGEDIPAFGRMINYLSEIEDKSNGLNDLNFNQLITALQGYLEKLILREAEEIKPFEEGVERLQISHRNLLNQNPDFQDISQVLLQLGLKPSEIEATNNTARDPAKDTISETAPDKEEPQASGTDSAEEIEKFATPDENLNDEEREIISGFIIESLENLETIEVSLIDLEQDPNDPESINSIFRSFHTIKGVSSFLSLMRINRLSHKAENLLDKVRSHEISISESVIDVILESVDLLKSLIEGVRDGMEHGTSLDIGSDIGLVVKHIDLIQERADEVGNKPLGEILIQNGELSSNSLEKGLELQKQDPEKKLGQILVEEKIVKPEKVVSALRDQKKSTARNVGLQVKVDIKKLDNLVELSGELVIAQSMLRQNPVILESGDQKLTTILGQITRITSGLQTVAMSMRMVPIKNTFKKMYRLVRDLAKNSGKEVQLILSGEETEIDRNMVDELYEPMVHMIRNSVDHGLEIPEDRKKAQKDRVGKIHLNAFYEGGKVIVEIVDDGKGLDRNVILAKALEKKLMTEEANLSDAEIYNMIFQPGFSTAKQVSDVSGRGVGMDVVRKAIEKLRGRVEINTIPGKGSTFIISLPLTLAIIEGMVVRVGQDRYIIPALAILKSFQLGKDQYYTVESKGEMVLIRDKLLPLIRLDSILGGRGECTDPTKGLVVAVEYEGHQMCLLLDELLGKEEVVIKSLGETLNDIKGVAGGAIMGDGRIGLILDMSGIWEITNNS